MPEVQRARSPSALDIDAGAVGCLVGGRTSRYVGISACAIFVTTGLYEFMAANLRWRLLEGFLLGQIAMRPLLSRKPGWKIPL